MFKAKHKFSLFAACLTLLLTMVFGIAGLFSAPTTPTTTATAATTTVTDTLTKSLIGVTGSSYTTWSGKKSNSTAVYAGQSSGGTEIQLRSDKSTSGIVTTASGGNVRKITVTWHSNTNTARQLDIYGSNTAYTQPSQLYSSSTQGTKLGSLKYSASPNTLTISNNYAYIGLRSSSGAMYLTSISIEWEVDLGGCETCDYSNGYTYTSNPGGVDENATHTKTGTCTVCGTEQIIDKAEKCTFDEGVVTPPTETANGYTTYTCVCGYSYKGNETPALNATKYTVSFSVPKGVEAVDAVEVAEGLTITLTAAKALAGYTFVGWTTAEYTTSTAVPTTIYEANEEYTVTENSTLYALYSYTLGSGGYKKVTNASTLKDGAEIIITSAAGDYAMGSNNNSYSSRVAITSKDNLITDTANAQIITLEQNGSFFYLKVGSKYLCSASSGNNLQTTTTKNNNSTWKITIDTKGSATITAQAGASTLLQYNASASRFTCYKASSNIPNGSIYMKDGAVYYTTDKVANIDGATVTVGAALKLNYKVTLPDAFASATMHFDFDGKPYDVAGVKQTDGRYVYSLPIPPQAMAINVKAELKLGDVVLDSMDNYSIQTYAQNQLNKAESSDELKQLLTDMLYYGNAAYNYVNETTGETPITDGVENLGTPSTAEPEEPEFKAIPVSNPDATSYPAYFKSAKVWFGDVNKIYIQVNTIEGVTLSVGDEEAVALTSHTIEVTLLATEFDEVFTFKLYHNGVLMQTLTYSVNAYAYKMKDHATMGELATALYNYGVSADAYAEAIA